MLLSPLEATKALFSKSTSFIQIQDKIEINIWQTRQSAKKHSGAIISTLLI